VVIINKSVVLVTGANGGLGEHFVAQALERGADRVYAGVPRHQKWDDQRVVPLTLDVTKRDSIAAAAAAAPDVTVVINSAGIFLNESLVDGLSLEARTMLAPARGSVTSDAFQSKRRREWQMHRAHTPGWACSPASSTGRQLRAADPQSEE
jgi:NAD(P)-dependent dehydrogenase (short-subunit alcohol dehydrogenase family)